MSTSISTFNDISSVLKENKNHYSNNKEYLSAIKTYNGYIQDAQNLITQKDQLLIEKINRSEDTNDGRLSYVNLMFADIKEACTKLLEHLEKQEKITLL